MAIKTKEEMFGDGAGFGAQVPISLLNPPGHGAGNRGIAFGEQLTSAIGNRTHYALVLNDEDLDARLVAFEAGGLDAAYDNGLAGPAGGGRQVTMDAGAIETASALSAIYDSDPLNAHYRANALGDVVGGSSGFDYKSDRVGASSLSGNDGALGIIDRRALAFATGNTVIIDVENVTLNPGGADATLIRLTTGGRKWHTSDDSALKVYVDLIEILSGTYAGVYIVTGFGALNTDVQVSRINGVSPTFAPDTATTASAFRPKLASFGGWSTRSGRAQHGVLIAGYSDSTQTPAALSILAGVTSDISPETDFPARALQFLVPSPSANGSIVAAGTYFDGFGRFRSTLKATSIPDADALYRGAYASRVVKSGGGAAAEIGHLVESSDDSPQRFDFMSMTEFDPGATNYTTGMTFNFDADSAANGTIEVSAQAFGSDFDAITPALGSMAEILTPAAQAGLYLISRVEDSAPDRFHLLNLDGSVPVFPAAGAGTFTVHTFSALGRFTDLPARDFDTTTDITLSPSCIVSVRDDVDAVGVLITSPDHDILSGDRWALVATTQTGTGRPYKVAGIRGDGKVCGSEFAIIDSSGEFAYDSARANTHILLPIGDGYPEGSTPEWHLSTIAGLGAVWDSDADNAEIAFVFRIPAGAILTAVRVLVDPGSAARASTTDRLNVIRLERVDLDFSTPGKTVTDILPGGFPVPDDNTGAVQVLAVTGLTETVTTSQYTFFSLTVQAGVPHSNDLILGVRITITDPGPRNF